MPSYHQRRQLRISPIIKSNKHQPVVTNPLLSTNVNRSSISNGLQQSSTIVECYTEKSNDSNFYKINTQYLNWNIDQNNPSVIFRYFDTTFPFNTPMNHDTSEGVVVDISSNIYGVPHNLKISHDSYDTSRSVYDSFNKTNSINAYKNVGFDQHDVITEFTNTSFLIVPSDEQPSVMKVSGNAHSLWGNRANSYWGRLFQNYSFTIIIEPIEVKLSLSDTPSNLWNLNCSQCVKFISKSSFGWEQALNNNYLDMFHHDISVSFR